MISTFDEMVSLLLEMQEDGSTGYQTAIEDMLLKAGVRFVPWAERTCGLQLGRN